MKQWKDVDISHSKKMEALGQLAGGVAHDFNNVLSIIEGYSRLMKQHIDPKSPAFSMVDHIMEASRRGTSLTRRLLAFGRHKIVADGSCDLVETIKGHEVLLKPLLLPRVKIDLNLSDDLIYVQCDRDVIWQILLNTCVNARDAITGDGIITVTASKIDKEVELIITDDGCGMSDEIARRAFEPFFTTKEQGKGTGLGLPMVYGLVEKVMGKIELKTGEDLGTSVIITLPISDKKPEEKDIIDSDGTILSGKTVLVVEDEPELLMLTQQVLEDFGMRALTAIDGDDALIVQDKFEGEIDILLTDLIMPNMGGVKLSELFTSLRPQTAVVYITGYPAHDRRLKDINLDDDAIFLMKPVQPDEIKYALQQALNKKHHSRIQDIHLDMQ